MKWEEKKVFDMKKKICYDENRQKESEAFLYEVYDTRKFGTEGFADLNGLYGLR